MIICLTWILQLFDGYSSYDRSNDNCCFILRFLDENRCLISRMFDEKFPPPPHDYLMKITDS